MATKIETPPAKAWAQVADQALNVPAQGNPQMRRYYKMPTSGCKNVLNQIPLGSSLGSVETWVTNAAGSLDNGLSGANFTPTTGENWVLNSYQMEQIEAGEYMIFKAVFSYIDFDVDSLSDDWEQTKTLSEQVTWQSYSVSPYIYCDEVGHNDTIITPGVTPPTGTAHALRRHIELAYTQNAQDSSNSPWFWRNQNTTFCLTESEQQIMKKVAAGVNPVFHKPIVQKNCIFRSVKESSVPQAGDDIDKISNPGVDVQGWNGDFIFTGRSWTKSSETYYTTQHPNGVTVWTISYIDTWEGALDPDTDFYGPNAWEFHKGPDGGNGGN